MTPTAGIVIPAFNAARTLPAVVRRIPADALAEVKRIWVVDDGSGDATRAVALRLADEEPRISCVALQSNRGYGGAMKVGLATARRAGVDQVVCLHADGQYAPELLGQLLQTLRHDRLDLLQGSRIASGTGLSGGMPIYKYVANRVLTALENRVFGLRMSDYHSGYLVYGRRALDRLPFDALSDSFDFDLEVIACARALRLRIAEQPVPTHYGDEVSYLNPLTYGLRVLRVICRYLGGHYHQLSMPASHEATAK